MAKAMTRPKQLPFTRLLILVVVIVLVAVGCIVYTVRQDACNAAPRGVSTLGNYDKPCEVQVTVIQQGRQANPVQDQATIHQALAGYHASINGSSLPDVGIYYITVKPGQEDMLVKHLRSQPGIGSAGRVILCVKQCDAPIDAN